MTIRALSLPRLCFILFALSLAANAISGHWFTRAHELDPAVEPSRTARALVERGTFSDPFAPMRTGPTAHVAPLYPALYAAILALAGTGEAAWWAIHLLAVLAYAIQWALQPALAAAWGLDRRIGAVAAFAGSLLPLPMDAFKWETVFAGFALAVLAYLTTRCMEEGSTRLLAITAAVWGAGFLLSPVLVPVWIACQILLVRFSRFGWRSIAGTAAISFLIVAPWLIRNYIALDGFVFIRSNFGTDFANANNDCASASYRVNIAAGCFELYHPNNNAELARRVATIGERRFNAERLAAGLAWVRANPSRFAILTIQRALIFWLPVFDPARGSGTLNAALISVLTLLSIPGLLLLYRKSRFAAWLTGSFLLAYSAIYYLMHVELRYRYPLLWITVLLAAVAVGRIPQLRRPDRPLAVQDARR